MPVNSHFCLDVEVRGQELVGGGGTQNGKHLLFTWLYVSMPFPWFIQEHPLYFPMILGISLRKPP